MYEYTNLANEALRLEWKLSKLAILPYCLVQFASSIPITSGSLCGVISLCKSDTAIFQESVLFNQPIQHAGLMFLNLLFQDKFTWVWPKNTWPTFNQEDFMLYSFSFLNFLNSAQLKDTLSLFTSNFAICVPSLIYYHLNLFSFNQVSANWAWRCDVM